jgi:hypothetical protein
MVGSRSTPLIDALAVEPILRQALGLDLALENSFRL